MMINPVMLKIIYLHKPDYDNLDYVQPGFYQAALFFQKHHFDTFYFF